MNKIRGAMSVFLLIIPVVAICGWQWTAVLPPQKQIAARTVLLLAALAAIMAMGVIWSAKPQKSH